MSGAPRTRSWLQQIIHTPGATSPGTIIIYRSTGTGSRSPFLAVRGRNEACLVSTQPVYQRAVLYIYCAGSHSTFLSPVKAQKHQIDELKPLGEAGVHLLCVTSLQLSEQRRRSPVCFPTAVVKLLRESETSLTNHICLINKAACNKAGISGSGNMQEIT